MQGILYEEASVWQFFFVTCLLGGWTAWRTGKAVSRSWGGIPLLVVYLLLLAVVIRFIHHALFDGTMFSPQYYVVDAIVLQVIGLLGFRFTRSQQMVRQYPWLYEPAGPFGWKQRTAAG